MPKFKSPTTTLLVFELLQRDVLTQEQIRERLPQCNANQISAALIHLAKRKAIAFLADEVTTLWYATPETDDRLIVVLERTPEPKGNRKRKRKS